MNQHVGSYYVDPVSSVEVDIVEFIKGDPIVCEHVQRKNVQAKKSPRSNEKKEILIRY